MVFGSLKDKNKKLSKDKNFRFEKHENKLNLTAINIKGASIIIGARFVRM
jgi:hypothetical protein